MKTLLTIPIASENVNQASELIEASIKAGAQMLELRIDFLNNPNQEDVVSLIDKVRAFNLPVIVTCRDQSEGGHQDLPQSLRLELLLKAVEEKAEYIDCEFANFKGSVKQSLVSALSESPKTRLILSAHHFKCPFPDLERMYDYILAEYPKAIPKLVYTANHINDCFDAFDLLHEKDTDAIVLCMGQAGLISRILAGKLGSLVTFTSLAADQMTAPGQISIENMKHLYHWDSIDSKTELYGVIGSPIAHSLSPLNFNACFQKENINAVYLPLLVEGGKAEFEQFMKNVTKRQWLDFKGFSVTIPHKRNAIDFATEAGGYIEPLAADIGAVNTIKLGYSELVSCYNTDYMGAMNALTRTMGIGNHDLHNVKVAVIGAGGVARAVVAGLTDVGSRVTIYNRTVSKAKALAKVFGCSYAGLEDLASLDAQVIVNCTSIGMSPHTDRCPVPQALLKEHMVIFDTVYNPLETLLLKQADLAGAKTVNGADMFIFQAMEQYRFFTGREADGDVENQMRETVFNCLKK